MTQPITFFDLETTSLKPDKQIVQIAAVKLVGGKIVDELSHYIRPTVPIEHGATKIHGITNEMVKNEYTFKAIGRSYVDFMKGTALAGYNSDRFDVPLFATECHRNGIYFNVDDYDLIDVMKIESHFVPRTLSAVYERYVGKPMVDAHDAIADIKQTAEVFLKMQEKYLLPDDPAYIELLINNGKPRLDLAAFFKYDDEDKVVFSKGKHIGKPVHSELPYLEWIISANFEPDTKKFAQKYIDEIKSNLFDS